VFICTIAAQRSGTKFLGSLFNTGTEVTALGEILNPDSDGATSFGCFLRSRPMAELFALGAEAVLDRYLNGLKRFRGAIHFDLMFNQLEFCCISWNPFPGPFMYEFIKARKFVAILLKRDAREILISRKTLMETGLAHLTVDAPPSLDLTSVAVEIHARELAEFEQNLQASYAQAEAAFRDYPYFITLDYADINAAQILPRRLIDTICACAVEHGVRIDPERLQLGPSSLRKTGKQRVARARRQAPPENGKESG